jgi:hypothetical protein
MSGVWGGLGLGVHTGPTFPCSVPLGQSCPAPFTAPNCFVCCVGSPTYALLRFPPPPSARSIFVVFLLCFVVSLPRTRRGQWPSTGVLTCGSG